MSDFEVTAKEGHKSDVREVLEAFRDAGFLEFDEPDSMDDLMNSGMVEEAADNAPEVDDDDKEA